MSTIEKGFDYADLVRRHIERCLAASHDMILYEREIRSFEAIVPEALTDESYTQEIVAAAYTLEEYKYMFVGPIKLGTSKKPLMAKIGYTSKRYPVPYVEDEDGNNIIDWDDPNIISPKLVEEEHINWDKRFYANFNLFYRLGFVVRMDS